MILIFETGNTTTNVVIYEGEKLIHKWKIVDSQVENEEDFKITVLNLFKVEEIDLNKIECVLISSVVRKLTQFEEHFCREHNLKFLNIKNKDVELNFDARETLGADLIANVFAGIELYKENFIIIDMGTATTFSIVGEKGKHLGEMYVSGVNTTLKALGSNCDLLPEINITEPKNVLGATTEEAMLSGIYYGYIGIVREVVNRILNETKLEMKVILAGGYSKIFIDELTFVNEVNEDITFDGIRLIYEKNRNNKKLW